MPTGQYLSKQLVLLLSFVCLAMPSMFAPRTLLTKYKKIEVKINPPSSYPSHQTQEELTIAVDPYWDEEKISRVFQWKDLRSRGILPVQVIVENGSAHPMVINGRTVQLLDSHHGSVPAMTAEEVLSILYARTPRQSPPVNLPFPIPKKSSPSSRAWQEMEDDLEQQSLLSCRIEPRQIRAGFVFFNLPRETTRETALRLYIPDIMDVTTNQPSLFIEVELK
jgi:hypothetical protein